MTKTGSARYPWLSRALAGDAAIITSSRRLARELRAAHDSQQLDAGCSAWMTPKIVYWRDWLGQLYESESLAGSPRAIDPNSSAILWERSIRRHLDNPLASPRSLLRQVRQTWQRLMEWRVSLAELGGLARSSDERAFATAARSYSDLLDENHWIDTDQALARAIELLQAHTAGVARRITHAGFDRIAPLIDDFFDALRAIGCEVNAAPRKTTADSLTKSSYVNSDAELRAAGAWARSCLTENPAAHIAIIAADLESNSMQAERLVREGLAQGWQIGGPTFEHAVDVSYGRRLSDYPAVHTALLCLRWCHRGLSSPDVSVLLRSRFLGSGDSGGRSKLELYLRRLPDRKWTAAALSEALASEKNSPDANTWLAAVQKVASMQVLSSAKDAPIVWVERIDALLRDIGWPGEGSLRSDEFQMMNRWRNLLNEVAALGVVIPEMMFSESIRYLDTLARETVFQPEHTSGLISLLGTLEAAGMEFDRLWVTGLDSSRWPIFGRPLSLVSRELQRNNAMPDASPQDSLQYSRRVLKRLTESAPSVHLSWARTEQDSTQSPSPLLEELPPQSEHEFHDPGWFAESLLDSAGIQVVSSDPVPAAVGIERVSGGAYTVQRQTIEPFAAFAYGRLGITEIRQFESGLSASLRGSLLHEALYRLLQAKPSQQDICEWSEMDSSERIAMAIDKAIAPALRHADGVLRRLFAMEVGRLHRVLAEFIVTEKARLPFSIEHLEETVEFEYAGIRLTLRSDRIDRLFDGSLLIIDYKSGLVKNLVDREGVPVDLQVVVYAAALNEEIGGLALFNIGSRGIQHKGIGGSVEWKNVPDDEWEAMLLRWKSLVHTSMEQIAAGDVAINLQLNKAQSRPLNVLSRAEERKRGV